MTSQSSPEASQPSQEAATTDELPVQQPSKNIVPEPNPGNTDRKVSQAEQGADPELRTDDRNEEIRSGATDYQNSVQELQTRVNGLEQRLLQAGLFKKPENDSQSTTTPEEFVPPKTSKVEEKLEPINPRSSTESLSLRDEREDKDDLGRVKISLPETKGPEESVQTLVDRVDSLERRLKESGHLLDKPAADKPRLPAIPQLHYVEWSEFKNKMAGEEQFYAIEVLVGGAKYYYQRSEEERKSKQRLKDRSDDRDQPITDHKSSTSLPERIRINSKPLILIMNQINDTDQSGYPIVILRPFKPLIYHEAYIREVFQRLMTRWGSADIEATTNEAIEPPIRKEVGGSTTPAVSHSAIGSVPVESKAETVPEHIVGLDNHTVTAFDKTVTGSDKIYSSPTAESSHSSPPHVNKSIEQSAITAAKEHSTEVVSEVDAKHTRDGDDEDLTDSLEALRDLRCLIEFIDMDLKPVVDSYRNTTRQKVPFCDLWHLFKPGDLLYCPIGSPHRDYITFGERTLPQMPNDRFQEVFRVTCTRGGRPHLKESEANFTSLRHQSTINAFEVITYSVDFNATRFVSPTFSFDFPPFSGERDITSLNFYPLRYAPKVEELKSKWKARGEAFREYTTFKYMYYIGKTLTSSPSGYRAPDDSYPKHVENIDSQVVVDFDEALAANPGWRIFSNPLTLPYKDVSGELSEDYPSCYWKDSDRKVLDEAIDDAIYDDAHIDINLFKENIERDPLLSEYAETWPIRNDDLDENHLMLLPNRVFAFVMKNRKWALLTIDGLRPIKRYDGGLKDLQLPKGHKKTISSLVGNHFISRNADLDDLEASYDADLVRGKGKGLIILLHGAPGVGKTSTAETVADAFGKLLLPITCGDLGLTAGDVERELSEKFHLAEQWDCVLLLDEADVFLARRTNTDIKRNSLVSVFLRVLEHFTGVLFLTTNRVGAFDEAFKSRIHISLYYPPLDPEKTWSIWKMNLERLNERKQRRNESMSFNENEIFTYSQDHYKKTVSRGANWNGRQIRNAFQIACALAEFEAHEKNKRAKARSLQTGAAFIPINPQLEVRHFKEIALASYEFDDYISETKGLTEAEIAHLEGQRMDEYRPSRNSMRDREQQPIQMSEAPAPILASNVGPRPKVQRQATTGDQSSSRRESKAVNTYGARTVISTPRDGRPTIARARPKTVQQPSSFAVHNRERRRQVVFDQPESQYEYEDQEETEYEQAFEGSLSQPTSTHAQFEDIAQREVSPRRRQIGDFPATSRKPAGFTYVEDFENDEDTFDI